MRNIISTWYIYIIYDIYFTIFLYSLLGLLRTYNASISKRSLIYSYHIYIWFVFHHISSLYIYKYLARRWCTYLTYLMFAKFSKKQNILYIDKHHVCVDLEQIPGLAYFISGSELIKVPRKKTTPVQQFGYGSIPINTIFNGMNIHLPAILMWTTGVQGFDTLPFIQKSRSIWLLILGVKTNWISMKFLWRSFSWCSRTMQLDANTNIRSLFEAKLSTKRGNKSITATIRCGTNGTMRNMMRSQPTLRYPMATEIHHFFGRWKSPVSTWTPYLLVAL